MIIDFPKQGYRCSCINYIESRELVIRMSSCVIGGRKCSGIRSQWHSTRIIWYCNGTIETDDVTTRPPGSHYYENSNLCNARAVKKSKYIILGLNALIGVTGCPTIEVHNATATC